MYFKEIRKIKLEEERKEQIGLEGWPTESISKSCSMKQHNLLQTNDNNNHNDCLDKIWFS